MRWISHTRSTVVKGKYELLSCFPWGVACWTRGVVIGISSFWKQKKTRFLFQQWSLKLEAFKKQKALEQLIRQWAAKQEGFVKTFPFLRSVRELLIEHSNPLLERRDLHFKRKGFLWRDILIQFHRLTPGHNNKIDK